MGNRATEVTNDLNYMSSLKFESTYSADDEWGEVERARFPCLIGVQERSYAEQDSKQNCTKQSRLIPIKHKVASYKHIEKKERSRTAL